MAEDSGNSAISKETQIEYNYESPYPKLEKPTNLVWDGLIAKWDAVTGATKYDLYVYENGSSRPVISKYDLTENQFDFTGNKNLKQETHIRLRYKQKLMIKEVVTGVMHLLQ